MLSKCLKLNTTSKIMFKIKPSPRIGGVSVFRMSMLTNKFRPFALTSINLRNFCTPFKPAKMSLEMTERLRIHQLNHEKDPKNVQAAYKYFKELNRVGMYHTVVRLYHKHDYDDSDKLRMQYDYAVDHLYQMTGLFNTVNMYSGTEDISKSQSIPRYLFKRVFQLLWRCMGLFVFVFIVTMIIKNINSRSLLDMYNFDLK